MMKRIPLLILIALSLLAVTSASAGTIYWPVGSAGTQNTTRTLFNSFGNFHVGWDTLTTPGFTCNFHMGIDILPYNGNRDVRASKGGSISDIFFDGDQYVVVVVDTLNPPVDGSSHGWSYQHLDNPLPYGWVERLPINLNDQISEMSTFPSTDHMHLSWSPYEYDSSVGSDVNPLDSLYNATSLNWIWNRVFESNPVGYDTLMFIPDMNHLDWPDHKNNFPNLLIDQNSLNGSIDILYGYCLEAIGSINRPFETLTMNPDKIEWTLFKILKTSEDTLFTKYVVDFSGMLGRTPEDSVAYRQFYFRLSRFNYAGLPLNGLISCITNCGDATGWVDPGISNIKEECWQTDSDLSGTGTATVRSQSLYPDGRYRIEITSYAHDGTPHLISEDVVVHNFFPVLSWAHFSNSLTDQVYWDAGWETVETTDGYEMEFVVNTDESTYPTGQTVDVEIHFSESMNPNCSPAPTIMLEVETGYCPQLPGSFSGTTVENDTWTGTAILPPMMLPGRTTLLVSCQDMSGEWLEDPANPGIPCMDTYHGIDIAFGIEEGWPEAVHDEVLGSPKLADIDLDGDLDVIIQCADGWVDVLDDDGSSMFEWPVNGGWSSGNPDVMASPAIINLTGDVSSAPEILAVHPSGCNGFMASGLEITGFNAIFTWYFQWFALCSPVAGDFTGDDTNEFAIGRQHVNNSTLYIDINLLAREADGSPLWDTNWGQVEEEESVSATPSLSDVNNDGTLNLLIATDSRMFDTDIIGTLHCLNASNEQEEWSTYVGGMFIEGALVTGNLDSDDYLEIVVGATMGSNSIKVLDGSTGTIQYTKPVSGSVYAGASIADIDGDGDNDIVVSCADEMLYCWDGPTGTDLSGFPVNLGTYTNDGVSIGDIDSDGMLELVIAGRDGKLHVINHDGSSTGGFPVTVSTINPLSGQPALGDIDGDGRLEILFGEENNSVIHCYEMADNSAYTYLPWPQFQHDAANTGYFPTDSTAPGAPSSLSETHTYDGDVVRVNLSWTASPDDPGDVICYRIYREIFGFYNNSTGPIATVSAGITTFEDRFRVYPSYVAVLYHVTAWDGLNESPESNGAKFPFGDGTILSSGCPVREIMHSRAIETSSSHAVTETSSTNTSIAIGTGSPSSSAIDDSEHRNNCGILTDGYYDAVYSPSSSSDCIEIDLGGVFTVNDVAVIRSDQSLIDSQNYEFSIDGRSFSDMDSGRARYVRVYGVSGATEVEIIGTTCEENSALIEIQRSSSEGYRIVAVEEGSPISATIFDLSGRSVWNSTSSTGEILWNRCNSSGNTVPAGVYLIMVESDDMETFTSKVIVR